MIFHQIRASYFTDAFFFCTHLPNICPQDRGGEFPIASVPNMCSPGGVHRLPHLLTLLDMCMEGNLVQQNARECGVLAKWNILVNRVRPFPVSSFAVDSAA